LSEGILPDEAWTSDHNARAFMNREGISEAVEEELARLREKRPGLVSRIDRASHLLVVHLSDPRLGTIRVRVGSDGRPRFVVRSLTSPGIYVIDPRVWSCSCPDFHRRHAACKHVLAAWCLKRAADRGAQRKGCALCINGWVYVGEDVIDSETGEVTAFHNPIRCRHCAGVQPPHLTDSELEEWMASVRWIYAKSMPNHPHEYCLKREQDGQLFEKVVLTVWDCGYDRLYLRRPWRSLGVGAFDIWVHTLPEPSMSAPLGKTVLINRALRVQERLV
jgi:SWIM zinc finger